MPKGVAGRIKLTETERGGCEFFSVSGLCREQACPALTQPGLITHSLSRKDKAPFTQVSLAPSQGHPWWSESQTPASTRPSAGCLWAEITSCVGVCRKPGVCLDQKWDSRGLGYKTVMLLCCVGRVEVWPGYL